MPLRPVSEVIDPTHYVAVTTKASVRDAARLMKAHHTSAVLVIDNNEKLVGICTERDVVFDIVAEGLDPDQTQVRAVMTEHPQAIGPDKPLGHALHLMFEGGFRHLPVVDAGGRPIGILSSRDALGVDAVEFEHELVRREEITVIL